MINVNQITAQMARMSDPALQQYAAMHKSDPYTLSLALSESNRRKQLRQGAQMGQQQQQPQPKVVDQEVSQMASVDPMGNVTGLAAGGYLPEEIGIGQLPAPNMKGMAEGGIVAFDEGGEVPGYAGGTQVKDFVQKYAEEYKVDPAVLSQIIGVESGAKGAEAKNPKSSAHGFGQIIEGMWGKSGGGDRSDPETQVRNAANLLSKNNKTFLGATGRLPTASEAYTTWVLGDSTGRAVLSADPNASVEAVIRKADPKLADQIISANKSVFGGKKVGDVMSWSEQKMLPVIAGGAAVAAEVPEKAGLPSLTSPTRSGAVANKLEQQRRRSELPDAIKQVQANRASSAAQIPGQGDTGAGYRSDMSVEDEARALINDRIEAEKKGTFFGRLGENLGLSAQTRDVIGKGVEGLAPYMGGATRVVRAPAPAVQASKPLPLRLSGPPAVQAEAGLPGLVPRLEGPSSIVGGSKPIPVSPEGVATLPRTGELVGQAAADEERLRQLAAASNEAKAARAEKLRTGDQLLAQKYDVNAAKAADDAAMAASKLDDAVPATQLANTIDRGAIQAANVAKVGAMTNAADRKIAGMEGGLPDMAKAMNLDEESRVIQQAPPEMDPADIQKIGKDATPKGERKGMSGEDFLMIGLGILSGSSPHAMVNIGEGGLKGLQMSQAARKIASEEAYHKGMLERYATPQELQMAMAYNDPDKRKAIEGYAKMVAQTKAEPMTKQKLFQEFIKSPAGQVGEFDKFDTYMQQWENRFGPIGGGLPKGTAVTRIG